MQALTFDWADVFATWYIGYPGRDPLECTIAVFEALYKRLGQNKKWVDGRFEFVDEHKEIVASDNRRIELYARFPTIFPDPLKELDDE